MKSLVHRVNASRPFTWQAFAWMGLGLFVFSPGILVNSVGYQSELWRAVLLLTLAIVSVSALLLNKLFLRGRVIGEAPWLSWFSIVGLAIFFPIVFRLVSLEIFELQALQPGFFRFITSASLWTLGTLVFAVIVNETREFKAELGRLRAELTEAQRLEREEQITLDRLRKKIVLEVTQTLEQAFESMRANSSGTQIADQLQLLIEDVVRPLSAKITKTDRDFSGGTDPTPLGQAKLRISLREVAFRLTETNPFEYKATPIIVAVSTLSIKTWVVPLPSALLSGLANIVFLSLVLFLSHSCFARYSARFNKQIVLFAIVTIFLVISLLDTLLSRLVMDIPPSSGNLLITFAEFGVLMFLTLFRAVPLERKRLLSELDATLSAINWMNSRRGQLIWFEQQRLARLVHGDIQARILATSLDLSSNKKNSHAIQARIKELQEHCEAALSAPAMETSLLDFLNSLKLMWAVSVDITSDISAQALALIDADSVAQDAVIEVIREALNNAVKHSQARRVFVSAKVMAFAQTDAQHSFSVVQVEVVSDVNVSDTTPDEFSSKTSLIGAGQGTFVYNQLSTDWKLLVTAEASSLVVSVPIGNVDQAKPRNLRASAG